MTVCVPPAVLFHITDDCLMRVTIGLHVYALSTRSAVVPDLAVLQALLQQVMSIFTKSTGQGRVALLVPYSGWWFTGTLYHIAYPSLTLSITSTVYHCRLP